MTFVQARDGWWIEYLRPNLEEDGCENHPWHINWDDPIIAWHLTYDSETGSVQVRAITAAAGLVTEDEGTRYAYYVPPTSVLTEEEE